MNNSTSDNKRLIFSVIDFVIGAFGLLCAFVAASMFVFSDDFFRLVNIRPGEESIIRFALVVDGVGFFISSILFILAGAGLYFRKKWGLILHIISVVGLALTCVGLPYTIYSFGQTNKEEFKKLFA